MPDADGTICVSGQACALTGTVTTSGPASANQIAYFTSATDITGSSTYTFNPSSTSGNSLALSSTALTTGSALSVTATSTPITSSSVSNGALFNLTEAAGTNATTYTGINLKFTDASTVAGNTEYAMQIQNQASAGSPTDNTVAALLALDNADTATGNLIAVTDGLLITNSGAASAGIVNGITIGSGTQSITNGLKIGSTGVTTDFVLQNGETLDNDTNSLFTFATNTSNADKFIIAPNVTASAGTFSGTLTSADLTGDHTWTLPNADGTICVSGQACALTGSVTSSGSSRQSSCILYN
jgi:hypothetical protein